MTTFDIDKEYLEPKRKEFTTIEETYMLHALVAASNSKDPSTQVGACYVSEDGRLLSVGCNHAPRNWNEDEYPWGTKEEYGAKNNKYTYVIHAEMAGMGNYMGSVKDFKNSTLYVTLFPCTNCAKLISELGVKRIVYLNARKNVDEFIYSSILLNRAGIECIDFHEHCNNLEKVELDLTQNEKSNIHIVKKSDAIKLKLKKKN